MINLVEYAKEDVSILKEEGQLAITGTRLGVVFLSFEDGKFSAYNNIGENLIGENMNEDTLVNWVSSIYIVEEN